MNNKRQNNKPFLLALEQNPAMQNGVGMSHGKAFPPTANFYDVQLVALK